LYTIQLTNLWVDNEILKKNPVLISKLKSKLKSENWKVRWNANAVLKENEIEIENLGVMDRIKAKYLNQYEI
jgi:predicted transcriptional regulator